MAEDKEKVIQVLSKELSKEEKEVRKRVGITYGIYKKYGMSRGYWIYRWMYELAKYLVG